MKDSDSRIKTEEIWRELSDRLRQFIQSRGASEFDVDDILQTVFIRIHSKLGDLQRVERLEAWVFQIARNAVVDHFRTHQRDRKRDAQIDVALLPYTQHAEESANMNAAVASCLGTLISGLPEDQRQATIMYELEGISQKEIAARESISLSGAKSRVQRGRKKLEAMLRDCCNLQIDRRGNVLQCGEDDCERESSN